MKKLIAILVTICILISASFPAVADIGLQAQIDYINGKRAKDGSNEEEDIPNDKEEVDPWLNVSNWKRENGYTFQVYGKTSVDLSPISNYLSILEDHDIMIPLQELLISNNIKDYAGNERDYVSSQIGESFYLTYIYYLDDSQYWLYLEVPRTYRPMDEALKLLMVSTLSFDETEADTIYKKLQYNVIDEICEIETEDYVIEYYEPRYSNGDLAGFVVLTVKKYLQ